METFKPEKAISTPFGALEIKERKEFDAVDIRVINMGERGETVYREKVRLDEEGEQYFMFQTQKYFLKEFVSKKEKPVEKAKAKKPAKKAAKKKTTKKKKL